MPPIPQIRTKPPARTRVTWILLLPLLCFLSVPPCLRGEPAPATRPADPRDIRTGLPIPSEGYCDQPYIVILPDGRWLCVLTTGKGKEGDRGQHVVATTSPDRGRTWTPLVDIEPASGPEASWAVPLLTPYGRAYTFYTFNGDQVSTLRGKRIRADMLGHFVFRYSDDFGKTWSPRHRLPMRVTAADRGNDWQGAVQIFWGICKPQVAVSGEGARALFSFTKLGRYMLDDGEGFLFRSDNLLTERDPAKLRWEMLPEADRGIRAPDLGSVQEEHNLAWLGGRDWLCVYRTTQGFPAHSYSRDDGRTWSQPEPMTYFPGGPKMKNPRACPKLFRLADGRLLLWYHNHSGTTYEGRNPAWVSGGIVRDGKVHWSQPEVLLYDDDPKVRMSYPDLVEQEGKLYITETQKEVARIHAVDRSLIDGLFAQGQARTVAKRGLILDAGPGTRPHDVRDGHLDAPLSRPLDLASSAGLTVELWLRAGEAAGRARETILSTMGPDGVGLSIEAAEAGALRLRWQDDRRNRGQWLTEPGTLRPGQVHHVILTFDAGPRLLTAVIDGRLQDGGPHAQSGFARWTGDLHNLAGAGRLRAVPTAAARLERARLYARPLRTSEAISHFHAGR